jgi:hypothetical protein
LQSRSSSIRFVPKDPLQMRNKFSKFSNGKQAKVAAIVVMLAVSAVAGLSQQPAPDVVLFNGKIFTSDSRHLYVEALAIRGERVLATGDSARIRALAGERTKQIDLGGRTVIPGINDAHDHLGVLPRDVLYLQFKNPDPTLTDVREAIAAARLQAHEGTILFGSIGPSAYLDPQLNRDLLDKLVPDHPVILRIVSGHASILNGAAPSQSSESTRGIEIPWVAGTKEIQTEDSLGSCESTRH